MLRSKALMGLAATIGLNKIILSCGSPLIRPKSKWVLDPTSAQFGIYQNFWERQTYERSSTSTMPKVLLFGFNKRLLMAQGKLPGVPFMAYSIPGEAAQHLHAALTAE
ncbi:hypothetical protein GQ44DRAFT_814175 [Phaeosphaeriaceae sp. PMI808]|nr:hypothetical protein GQ44DRAFT_814175 [Phaeosphaeriaceae sp. PMI808]